MEKEPYVENPKPESPKFKFTLGGRLFNLEELLSPDYETRKAAAELRGGGDRGDEAAWQLVLGLQRTGLLPSEYARTMPRLLEYIRSSKPEGGYDIAFIGNVFRIFDETAEKMNLVDYRQEGKPVTFFYPFYPQEFHQFDAEHTREVFFARAYGKIETLYEEIWNPPTTYNTARYNLTRQQRKAELRHVAFSHPLIDGIRTNYGLDRSADEP